MTDQRVAPRFRPFGTTIFAEMTRLANEHQAVNLSQGFPDFDGPEFVRRAAQEAIAAGYNQYARTQGVPPLNEAIGRWWRRWGGRDLDPHAEITVTSGCTEALAASLLGLAEPGDRVAMFEPFYDSYRACVAMAGATPRFITLHSGEGRFDFDKRELTANLDGDVRILILNTPHNPTGKVFAPDELRRIADRCIEHDIIVVADEVYERLTFDRSAPHVSISTLPGMSERTVVCSSFGKTFSLTGWKIGWAIAPPDLTAAVRAAHQFLTFATATPLQHAAAVALGDKRGEEYVASLVAEYDDSRKFLCQALGDLGFGVINPQGTYFVMADHRPVSDRLGLEDDVAFCRWLTEHARVAAIPPSVFYDRPGEGQHLVRFAFCKRRATLEEAARRLETALRR